ncbi:protein O-GlcNAcase [Alphaproteobacteria bacterium]|nr:protein O-GlcNAcase [Alphaproteobacteria bacterium]
MKLDINNKNINGYIEGFYGRLLNWGERKNILDSLSKNKMNAYFYAPKEDINHRLHWRNTYSMKWRKHFLEFTNYSKKKNIEIIAGIAPGLDFNFKDFHNEKNSLDFNLLIHKAKQLLADGAVSIALLLDDIPNNFQANFGKDLSEGFSHGLLANKLSKQLGRDIYFVPRIYADELNKDNPNYLKDLGKILDPNIKVFYCGKNIVTKSLNNYSKINKILNNRIIFWDNYYANDYCPRRLFIGPYVGRREFKNIMINPTGLVNTDLLILDIVAANATDKFYFDEWHKILNNHGIPEIFKKVKQFFLKPHFYSNSNRTSFKYKNNYIIALDVLLWEWKSDLSREWYPFILGLKQDLLLNRTFLNYERLMKTQTIPLSNYIDKNFIKEKLQ